LLTAILALFEALAWRPNTAMPAGSGDRWPDYYERGRPAYPPQVVDVPGLTSTASVLDLAAGTGKLTRLLVRAFDHVVAVEPAEPMRRRLDALCPAAEAMSGTAEEIPLDDASVDAVFAAESFHWFDGERALAEIARVLRPAGALVLMWNLPAAPTEPSIERVERLLAERGPTREELGAEPLDLDAERYRSGAWRPAFESSPFEVLHETRLPNPQILDREGMVAFFASMGWIGDLPDSERLPLLDQVRSLLDAPEYRRSWQTHVCRTRLG
jgi:SAM-dependent methyltransferase